MDVQVSPYNLKAQHDVEAYKEALKACRPMLRGTRYLDMLKANYYAPDHTVTPGEMAIAVGYRTWSAANRQYGVFAGAIAEALGHERGALEGAEVPVTVDLAALVSFGDEATGKEATWQMLPAVAEALEEMGWVKAS